MMDFLCTYVQFYLTPPSMIQKKSGGKNATIGMNSSRKLHRGSVSTRHAEVDAMLKLPSKKNKSRRVKISLIVIRINHKGDLKSSRPCLHCLKRLQYLYLLGYNLCNIYYSNEHGNIVKAKYMELLNDKDQHVSRGNRI